MRPEPLNIPEGTAGLLHTLIQALSGYREVLPPSALRARFNVALDALRVAESWLAQGCQCARGLDLCPLHSEAKDAPERG